MKRPSMKEISAFIELIIGTISLYNYFLTDFFDEKLLDMALFRHRCFCISLTFMSFFYSLRTWFCYSNIKTTRMLNRLHKIFVYLILNILLLWTHFSYKSNYMPLVRGYFDHNIFFDEIDRMQMSFIFVIIILILSLAVIGINVNLVRFRIVHLMKKTTLRQLPE